jgi:hypothetical protein
MNKNYLKFWLKYDDGSEYIEYRKVSSVVPPDVTLYDMQFGTEYHGRINRIVDSSWSYVDEKPQYLDLNGNAVLGTEQLLSC